MNLTSLPVFETTWFHSETSRTFVIGDIHGQHRMLDYLLRGVRFDYELDTLICLGDYADGRSNGVASHNLFRVISILSRIKNKILLKGNHDLWAIQYLNNNLSRDDRNWWTRNGGDITLTEFKSLTEEQNQIVLDFYSSLIDYYETNDYICVHAGRMMSYPMDKQSEDSLFWSREFVENCVQKDKLVADKLTIVGHTIVQSLGFQSVPTFKNNVLMMDTGAGYGIKLSITDITDINKLRFYQISK